MFIDRMIEATNRLKEMCKEQRLKNFERNAEILTVLKYGKRKKKMSGKFSGKNSGEIIIVRSLQFKGKYENKSVKHHGDAREPRWGFRGASVENTCNLDPLLLSICLF